MSLQRSKSEELNHYTITTGNCEGFSVAKEAVWSDSEKYLCTADFYAVAVT
jgi:hypothetical protein